MTNNLSQDLKYNLFRNFQKHQNVSKRKLCEEHIPKGWNTCTTGFIKETTTSSQHQDREINVSFKHMDKKEFLKCNNDKALLLKSISKGGIRVAKRKSMLDIGNIETEFNSNSLKPSSNVAFQVPPGGLEELRLVSKKEQKSDEVLISKEFMRSMFLQVHTFQKDPSEIQSKSFHNVSSGLSNNFFKNLLSEQCRGQENVPKKIKMYHNHSIDSSIHFTPASSNKTVSKLNISSASSHTILKDDSFHLIKFKNTSFSKPTNVKLKSIKNFSHNSIIDFSSESRCAIFKNDSFNAELCKKSTFDSKQSVMKKLEPTKQISVCSVETSNVTLNCEHSAVGDLNLCEISPQNVVSLLKATPLDSKGSNWVQSLKSTPATEEENCDHQGPQGRKKLRNLVQGGFAEQIIKLQRRQKSERVIWDHKLDKHKMKDLKNSISLLITDHSQSNGTVITRCVVLPTQITIDTELHQDEGDTHITSSHGTSQNDRMTDKQTYQTLLVVFKRSLFSQLQLKIKATFRLYKPWQMLHLKSVPYPIILCAYFVDVDQLLSKENVMFIERKVNEALVVSKSSMSSCNIIQNRVKLNQFGDSPFFSWRKLVSFSGRIQRIWRREIAVGKYSECFTDSKYLRIVLLIQMQDCTFCEVLLSTFSSPLSSSWHQFISSVEGKCCMFHNLRVSHRIHTKESQHLFSIIRSILLQQNDGIEENCFKQQFCYQFMFNDTAGIPEIVSEDSFPGYYPTVIRPLAELEKQTHLQHFTCIGKLLFQHDDCLYMSDETLLHATPAKFIQLQFLSPFEAISFELGTCVFIKEALIDKGNLILDRCSEFVLLHEQSAEQLKLSLQDKRRLKQLNSLSFEKVVLPLNPYSQVADIVSIKGEVINVDESEAFTWLQCNLCFGQNLVQDPNFVIYCEDCLQIVPKAILNVKMEVTIQCDGLNSTAANVQPLSSTVKEILQIDNGTLQPQCTVADILGKKIGPLFCFIRRHELNGSTEKFFLSEIKSK